MSAPAVSADLLAEALFASDLQPSEHPSSAQIWDVVHAAVIQLGECGCTDRVAVEFGEHPVEACRRMRWARSEIRLAFGLSDDCA